MIPLAVPNLSGKEREYLNECIDSTFVSSVGPFVDRLENEVARISGTKYGVAVSSGTTGLHIALVSYGVKRDDVVIVPSFTFIASANAIAHCGAMPWFIDVRADSWTMDEDKLEKELKNKTYIDDDKVIYRETGQGVSAIMPVYTLGNVPNMDRIKEIASSYNLPIIADAAAAIGSEYKGRKCGEMADCTVFSFNGNKTVTSGGGGAVVLDDEMMKNRIKHLSTTARTSPNYDFDEVGYNYRMTNIQAAVGCAQLERVDSLVSMKRQIRKRYNEELGDVSGISLFPIPDYVNSACWFSGIIINDATHEDIKKICEELREMGIEARTFWKPVHMQPPYADSIRGNDLSVTENIWEKVLTLPCSTGITDEEIEEVISAVRKVI